jgi:hypothetical protein
LNLNKTKQNFPNFFVEQRKNLSETNHILPKKIGKRKDHFFSPKHQWLQYIIVMHQTPKLLSYLGVVGKVCNMDE